MIPGHVSHLLQPLIRLTLHGSKQQQVVVDALVDTGFTQYLTLPSALVAGLELPFVTTQRLNVADGQTVEFLVFEAVVEWDGRDRAIPVHQADGGVLVGMSLLHGYELCMHVVDGGYVTIERVP